VGVVAGRGTDFPVRGWGFSKPSAEMGVGRFYGQEDLPENQPFVCGSAGCALSFEAQWVRASINRAAGIRCCDLRYPGSVGIIRVVSGDREQEMITEFFPQIQDSTENDRTTCGHLIAGMLHSRKYPDGGFADCTRPLARGRRNRFKQGGG